MNTNQTNVRRTIVLPVATEVESEVNVTNDNHPGYDASTAEPRFPRCVRARPTRKTRFRVTKRWNSAA